MSTIKPNQLESEQAYSQAGKFGFKTLEPVDNSEDDTICPECGKEKAWDEGYCHECKQAEKEMDEAEAQRVNTTRANEIFNKMKDVYEGDYFGEVLFLCQVWGVMKNRMTNEDLDIFEMTLITKELKNGQSGGKTMPHPKQAGGTEEPS